jgi:branched-chain amino acid transport system permease protein
MKKMNVWLSGAALLLLALVPLINNESYVLQVFIMIMLFAYWASSWNIIGGFAGQLSLGHSAFAGIGAYASTILFAQYHMSPWIGMLVGGIIAGLFGLVIGYPCFKLRGTYYTLATIAFLYIVSIWVLANQHLFGVKINGAKGMSVPWKGGGLLNMQFVSKVPYYYIMLGLLIVVVAVSLAIKKSRIGYYLAAIKTNQEAANSLGVNVTRYKLTAQFVSAFFTAVGGTFYAQFILFIDPQRLLGYDLSFEMALFAVIGGQGTVFGPVLGAFILVPISELTRSSISGNLAALPVIIYGLCLMIIVYYLPEGILKSISKWIKTNSGRNNRKIGDLL